MDKISRGDSVRLNILEKDGKQEIVDAKINGNVLENTYKIVIIVGVEESTMRIFSRSIDGDGKVLLNDAKNKALHDEKEFLFSGDIDVKLGEVLFDKKMLAKDDLVITDGKN
jgi:predicted aconitase with swiveling domain